MCLGKIIHYLALFFMCFLMLGTGHLAGIDDNSISIQGGRGGARGGSRGGNFGRPPGMHPGISAPRLYRGSPSFRHGHFGHQRYYLNNLYYPGYYYPGNYYNYPEDDDFDYPPSYNYPPQAYPLPYSYPTQTNSLPYSYPTQTYSPPSYPLPPSGSSRFNAQPGVTKVWIWIPGTNGHSGYRILVPSDQDDKPVLPPDVLSALKDPNSYDINILTIINNNFTTSTIRLPARAVTDNTLINVPGSDGTSIMIVPTCDPKKMPPNLPGSKGFWRYVPAVETSTCGYYQWIATDAPATNDNSQLKQNASRKNTGTPAIKPGAPTIGEKSSLPEGVDINISGGDAGPSILRIIDTDGSISDVAISPSDRSSIIAIPLDDGSTVTIQIGEQNSPPNTTPSSSLGGHWSWVRPDNNSKGYWLWIDAVTQ